MDMKDFSQKFGEFIVNEKLLGKSTRSVTTEEFRYADGMEVRDG